MTGPRSQGPQDRAYSWDREQEFHDQVVDMEQRG